MISDENRNKIKCPGTELNRRHADFQSESGGPERSNSTVIRQRESECHAGVTPPQAERMNR